MVGKTVPKSTDMSLRTEIKKKEKEWVVVFFTRGEEKREFYPRICSWQLDSDTLKAFWIFDIISCHFPAVLCRFRPWNLYDSCQQSRMHHEKLKAASKHKESHYLFEESEDSQVVPRMIFFWFFSFEFMTFTFPTENLAPDCRRTRRDLTFRCPRFTKTHAKREQHKMRHQCDQKRPVFNSRAGPDFSIAFQLCWHNDVNRITNLWQAVSSVTIMYDWNIDISMADCVQDLWGNSNRLSGWFSVVSVLGGFAQKDVFPAIWATVSPPFSQHQNASKEQGKQKSKSQSWIGVGTREAALWCTKLRVSSATPFFLLRFFFSKVLDTAMLSFWKKRKRKNTIFARITTTFECFLLTTWILFGKATA